MDEKNTQDSTNTAEIAVPEFAFDKYLNLDGIKGESTNNDHLDWILALSFGR